MNDEEGVRVDGRYLDHAMAIPLSEVDLPIDPAPAVPSSARSTMMIETPHLRHICSSEKPQAVVVTRDVTYVATTEQAERWLKEVQ